MKILGINISHDAGVALVEDGQIVAAINEERLNRRKFSSGIPFLSLQKILSVTEVKPSELKGIAVAGYVHRKSHATNYSDCTDEGIAIQEMETAETLSKTSLGSTLMRSSTIIRAYNQVSRLLPQKLLKALLDTLHSMGIHAPIYLCDHHTAHLASAYYTSGWNNALLISNDGFGDGYCSKVAVGHDGVMTEIDANPFYNSIGMYYLYVTNLCGFPKSYHAGKTTGLAAFGNPEKTIKYFEDSIIFDDVKGRYINRGRIFREEIKRMHKSFNGIPKEHLAAGMQYHLENILTKQANYFLKKTKLPNLALAGGVHANVRANQKIAALPGVEGVFIHPNMGDGGLGVGAALWLWAKLAMEKGEKPLPKALPHVYFGPSYSDGEVEKALEKSGLVYSKPAHVNREIAKALSEGKIVARFDGRMEYGPRSLGNRSILYQATDPSANTWLNHQLKRTEFMPFAPVIRDKDAHLFLKNYEEKTTQAARFMTITYDVTEKCKKEAPAVVHIDGTARPQIISQQENPGYYKILEEYHQITGLSVLVNTSFNMHEEPIVCRPDEAIQAFLKSHLDLLVLNSFLVCSNNDSSSTQ